MAKATRTFREAGELASDVWMRGVFRRAVERGYGNECAYSGGEPSPLMAQLDACMTFDEVEALLPPKKPYAKRRGIPHARA